MWGLQQCIFRGESEWGAAGEGGKLSFGVARARLPPVKPPLPDRPSTDRILPVSIYYANMRIRRYSFICGCAILSKCRPKHYFSLIWSACWLYCVVCGSTVALNSSFFDNFLLSTPSWSPAWLGRSVSSVCLFVRALTGKQLELSTPNLVHVYSIAVARQALTQMSNSKGQRSRSHSTKIVTVARLLSTVAGIPYTYTPLCYLRPLSASVCMSIRLSMFSSYN